MPIETASYISQLNPAYPLHTDLASTLDAHERLTKSVLQTQFPNLGTTAVTATAAALNLAAAIGANAGVVEISQSGSTAPELLFANGTVDLAIVSAPTDGSGRGELSLTVFAAGGSSSVASALLSSTGLTVSNPTNTASVNTNAIYQGGAQLLPPGGIILWYGGIGNIPAGYALCNGQTVTTAAGTFTTPNLVGSFVLGADGATWAPGQTGGQTTFTGTTTTQPNHSHGGATVAASPGTPSGSVAAAGAHNHTGATGGYSLTQANLPPHTHGVAGVFVAGGAGTAGGSGSPVGNEQTDNGPGSATQFTMPISTDGGHTHTFTGNALAAASFGIQADGAHNHTVAINTIPPFMALCYIMRVL